MAKDIEQVWAELGITQATKFEHPHADCHEMIAMWESWSDEAKKEIRKLQAENDRLEDVIARCDREIERLQAELIDGEAASGNMEPMTNQDETLALLRAAREVLQHYWFTSEDGDEFNNDDVIDVCDRIDAHLRVIDGEAGGTMEKFHTSGSGDAGTLEP